MAYTAKLAIRKPRLTSDGSFVRQHMPRAPRKIEDRQPCKEIAAVRLREFLWELGAEMDHEHGWKAFAIKRAGFKCYHTGWSIIQGEKITVGPDVVDQVSMATGCPISVFYDLEPA